MAERLSNHPIERNRSPEEQQRAEVLQEFAEHPFANLETYKYFNQVGPEAVQAKQEFIDAALNGETLDTPGFHYSALDVDALAARRDELTDILHKVLRLDMSIEENRLLREKVTDRLHEAGI